MINYYLKAKHWQIFILMIGVPILFQVFAIIYLIISKDSILTFSIFPIFMLLFMSVFFGWFWSIGVGLNKFLPQESNLNITKFKIFLLIPFFYVIFLMFSMLSFGVFSDSPPSNGMFGISFAIIIPLHLFSMFCMFYIMYFCSKTIKSIELKREAIFSDYVGEFFLLWFYMIGIWILQPKINKIYVEKVIDATNVESKSLN
jgi:hypothetical protein